MISPCSKNFSTSRRNRIYDASIAIMVYNKKINNIAMIVYKNSSIIII